MGNSVKLNDVIRRPMDYMRYLPNGKIDGGCIAYNMLKTMAVRSGMSEEFNAAFDGKVEDDNQNALKRPHMTQKKYI